jgi:hypothetical protein
LLIANPPAPSSWHRSIDNRPSRPRASQELFKIADGRCRLVSASRIPLSRAAAAVKSCALELQCSRVAKIADQSTWGVVVMRRITAASATRPVHGTFCGDCQRTKNDGHAISRPGQTIFHTP